LEYCKLDRRIVQREIRQIDNNHYWRFNIDINNDIVDTIAKIINKIIEGNSTHKINKNKTKHSTKTKTK
jgi:hypothetical protein